MPILLYMYQLFTKLLGPIIYNILYYYRLKIGKENPARRFERKGYSNLSRPNGDMIWFHAASNGESIAAISVIKLLHQHYPQSNFLITTGTLTSAQLIGSDLPNYVQHQFVPSDVPQWIERFLQHWHPQLFITFESEIWPNLIVQTVEKLIPIALLNGRMSDATFKKWYFLKNTSRYLMAKFNLILAQSEYHQHFFKTLGAQHVNVMQNIKFLNEPLDYSVEDFTTLQQYIGNRPLWVAASTHEHEEIAIVSAHKMIKIHYPDLLTIIIPRHPIRAPKICGQFDHDKLPYVRRSIQPCISAHTEIYLVDTIGELGLFYRLSNIVFLGGSLANIGGHNIIEPALLNNAIICGPHMHKQQDIMQIFTKKNAIINIDNDQDLACTVIDLLQHPLRQKTYQDKAYQTVVDQQKVGVMLLAALRPLMLNSNK